MSDEENGNSIFLINYLKLNSDTLFTANKNMETENSCEYKKEKDGTDQLQLVVDSQENDGPTIAKMEDVITIDPECKVLDLNHARIGKIEHLEQMAKLERLYLRWNLLKKIENLEPLTRLVELELYDNQITEIENLNNLVNLE